MTKLATRAALKAATNVTRPAKPASKAWLVPQTSADRPSEPAPTQLPLSRIELSPLNVRTDERDTSATSALEGSILARGIILPLVVHPLTPDQAGGREGIYGVVAGGRRYRSVRNLVARGAMDGDPMLPVVVRDLPEAELLELSTAENLLRRDLRDYEVFMAVRRAYDAGEDVGRIADALGQEAVWVRRCLRLGQLAPRVFQAFAEELITAEAARAYAATEDHGLQLAVFEQLQGLPDYQRKPSDIRARMGIADAQLTRLLRFVGEEPYRAAGGRYELDLFADAAEMRGRIVDPEILRALADEGLARVKADARTAAGRDVRFQIQPPRNDFGTDFGLLIEPEGGDLAKLPEGDIVATVDIAESGEPNVRWWWASRKAKTGKAEPKQTAGRRAEGSALATGGGHDATAAQHANAAIRESEGLSSTGVEVLRSLRRTTLRAMLIESARRALQADIATDYLVWAQIRMLLGTDSSSQTGMAGINRQWHVEPGVVRPHVDSSPGHAYWEEARAEISREAFMKAKSAEASLKLYRDAPRAVKELAAAIVTGLSLERSLDADGYRVPVHDIVAVDLAGGHVANCDRQLAHWVPAGEAFLGLIPTKELLAIADPWIERTTAGKWQRLKRHELVKSINDMLGGVSAVYRTAGAKVAAMQWFHPLLRFAGKDAA